MANAKKLFLLHERRETVRVRFSGRADRGWCDACGREVIWLTIAAALGHLRLDEVDAFRLAENGSLHFTETDTGLPLVCSASLGAILAASRPRVQKEKESRKRREK